MMMEESIMVMEKARPYLDSLSQLAPELNKATDLYVAELKKIESELNALKLGIAIELRRVIKTGNSYTDYDDRGEACGVFYTAWRLGYGKSDRGEWCFLLREYKVSNENVYDTIEESVTPLLELSRELRIAAAEFIPELLKEIESQVKKKIEILAKVSENR